MKSIIYLKGSEINDVRLQKFLRYFTKRKADVTFWGWSRLREKKEMDGVKSEYLLSGGGYGKRSKLFFYYFMWTFVVFWKCIKTDLHDKILIAIDFDSALPVYWASKIKKIHYIYEVYDDFALRYKFPTVIKKAIHKLDTKVMRGSQSVIHVDANRVTYKDCKWIVIENSPIDIFSGKERNYDEIDYKFAVIGHLSKERGLSPILKFAKCNSQVKFLVVGRFIDEEDRKAFRSLANVEYYDYMLQNDLFQKMGKCCSIFSLYDPSLEINRLAASNKVYDAMMFGIPVITNKEVINSGFIKEQRIGFVIDYDYNETWDCLLSDFFMDDVRDLGSNGRKLFLNKYQFEELVNQRLMPILNEI